MSPTLQSFWWVLALLPVAALSGWFIGRRGAERSGGQRVSRLSSSYFRGLNFLLNEQPDKAIEVFLQIAEIDKDTVETHFALGNLFRRRGEVDRAIRIHQTLMKRPQISEEQRVQAVLELGEDFMRAGLLDRAEMLFSDLGEIDQVAPKALQHLIWIYQQERDWAQAIAHARRYEAATGEPMGKLLSQFHCELAAAAHAAGDHEAVRAHLRDAYEADSHCIRAGIIEGQLAQARGDDAAAIRAFERIARHDVDYLPEVLDALLAGWERTGERGRARAFLAEMVERAAGVSPMLALARLIREDDGDAAAMEFLERQLRRRPSVRGQNALIDLSLQGAPDEAEQTLRVVRELSGQLVASATSWRCGHCGFGARTLHWQCPSCKRWGTIRPVHGAFGE